MNRESASSVRGTVLVVDDESSIRDSLRMVLEYEDYRVFEASTGGDAIDQIRRSPPDAVLLDIKMPEMDGLEVLQTLQDRGYNMPIIVITGHGDVSTAIEATRKGAYDFFEKPLERDRVLLSLRNAVESYRLQQDTVSVRSDPDDLVGSSETMQRLRQTIDKAAPANASVLIMGESGTGKELVARALHRQSSRAGKPIVHVNCAAIPEELIESELFGHEKGSFTGAVRKQLGKFVAADTGTIFLDEIGDMSARTQAKVLRVLQSGEVEPVGAQQVVTVDVRVIAATNRDLEKELAEGRFREDLYYRLNVVPIFTPTLRDHLEDLPELVNYFVRRYAQENNAKPKAFSPKALDLLRGLPWKGNIRELKNVLERVLILGSEDPVTDTELTATIGGQKHDLDSIISTAETLKSFRDSAERLFLIDKLERNDWNVTRTAKAIATPRSNLYKKMEQYGIQRSNKSDG
jgi:two-component system nitrogen regulation response regulator NtrX